MALVVVSLFGALVGRLGQVQIGQHSDTAAVAARLATRSIETPAVRGRILDAGGKPLVTNTTRLALTIQRASLLAAPDGGVDLVTSLAAAVGLPAKTLLDRTQLCGTAGAAPQPRCFDGSPYAPIVLADSVDPRRALTVTEQPERFPGVEVVPVAVRTYPSPAGVNAAHLLGYLGQATASDVSRYDGAVSATDDVGRAGLEAQYDELLRGTDGVDTVTVDPRGVVTSTTSSTPPVPGRDLVTHLSTPVQATAERALRQAVSSARSKGFAADSAAAVVLDVRSGAVVAAASYPTYDPSVWTGGISNADLARLTAPSAGTPLLDRVTDGLMPPASTFKAVSVDAIASRGADLGGTYDCTSAETIGSQVFHNYESKSFGPLSLERNLEVSCDTVWYRFAYQQWLAQGGLAATSDAADPFLAAARSFGLGKPTGIDLPDESSGRVPSRAWKQRVWQATRAGLCAHAQDGYPEVAATDPTRAAYLRSLAVENCATGFQYRAGDAANFAIGQGDVLVTPLQLAQVYEAVANGGTIWRPQIGAATQDPDGTHRVAISPVVAGHVGLAPGVKAFLDTALQGVVTSGTAAGVFAGWPQSSYPVAGKTGSAEIYGKQATSWFASYGPVFSPRYAVVVMVSQAGTGSGTAAPAARSIWETLRTLQ